MRAFERHLHVVSTGGSPVAAPQLGSDGDPADLALAAALFAVFFLPIASALAHVGRWSPTELGLAAAGSIFAGRALWDSSRDLLRDRRRS